MSDITGKAESEPEEQGCDEPKYFTGLGMEEKDVGGNSRVPTSKSDKSTMEGNLRSLLSDAFELDEYMADVWKANLGPPTSS